MWKFIIENWHVLFGGAGVAIAAGIIGLVFKRKKANQNIKAGNGSTNIQPGSISAQTRDHSPVQQITSGGLGPVFTAGTARDLTYAPRIGFSGDEVKEILKAALPQHAAEVAGLKQDKEVLTQEKEQLQDQLAAAIRRADRAEKQRQPDTGGLIEGLRKSGDTARLLKFLLAERSRLQADKIEINREISAVAYLRGEIDTAQSALAEILQALPDDLDALNRTGHIYLLGGDLDQAERAYQRVLGLATSQQHRDGQAAACGNLGLIYRTRGDLDQAEEMHRKSLEIERQLGRKEAMAADYGNLGLIYKARGDLDEAERMHRKGLQINEQLGRKEGMAQDYGNLGLIYKARGDLDEAEKMHRKGLQINEQLGRKEGMAIQYGNLGLIYQARGFPDEAEEMHRKGLQINEQLGRKAGMAIQYGNLGLIYKARGDLDEAEKMFRKALQINEQLGRKEGMAIQYGNLGLIYQARGDLDRAEAMYRKALQIHEQLPSKEGMANQYSNLGLIYRTRGDLNQARSLWTKSRDLYAEIGMPHMVKKVEALLNGLDSAAPEPSEEKPK